MKKFICLLGCSLLLLLTLGCQALDQQSTGRAQASDAGWDNYVSDGYAQRTNGADWVAVRIKKIDARSAKLSIRSRADRKRPSCTYDTLIHQENEQLYSFTTLDAKLSVKLDGNTVTLTGSGANSDSQFGFFCSGGASFLGHYTKIKQALDTNQIDHTDYFTGLSWPGLFFSISAKDGQLNITPLGLSADNQAFKRAYSGEIINAEIEDLDQDGYPEILVYTAFGNNQAGQVIGISCNADKSYSEFYFPAQLNAKLQAGYQGHDSYAVVENILARQFPLFQNGKASGQQRQINYRLKNGETSKVFVVDSSFDWQSSPE